MTYERFLKNTGKAEWMQQGKIEGKIEKALEVASNLLKFRIDATVIAKSTKLPVKKIKELEAELNSHHTHTKH